MPFEPCETFDTGSINMVKVRPAGPERHAEDLRATAPRKEGASSTSPSDTISSPSPRTTWVTEVSGSDSGFFESTKGWFSRSWFTAIVGGLAPSSGCSTGGSVVDIGSLDKADEGFEVGSDIVETGAGAADELAGARGDSQPGSSGFSAGIAIALAGVFADSGTAGTEAGGVLLRRGRSCRVGGSACSGRGAAVLESAAPKPIRFSAKTKTVRRSAGASWLTSMAGGTIERMSWGENGIVPSMTALSRNVAWIFARNSSETLELQTEASILVRTSSAVSTAPLGDHSVTSRFA